MLIFIKDSKKQLIGVCTIRGFFCQGVITTGVTNPRGIAVQPNHGKMKIPVKPRIVLGGKSPLESWVTPFLPG